VDEVRDARTGNLVEAGTVDVGKHLRPVFRMGRVVLFVDPAERVGSGEAEWRAIRLL
jgi:hypothetical protein